MTRLGIIIVNWNTVNFLRDCLTSVYASQGVETYEVVVVDNASTDGSAKMVRAEFPQATLIASDENVGYPRGNNLGLRHLGYESGQRQPPEYAVLLNPDTVVPPDAFARMLAFMNENSGVGVAGPRLYLEDGSLDLACRRSFPSPNVALPRMLGLSRLFPNNQRLARYNLTFLDEYQTAEVDSVVGAFMQVRGEAIAQVGLLDERFFMYAEDLDWAKRIKDAGWKIMYYPQVEVLHIKRAASRMSKRARFEFYRAMWLYYQKHDRRATRWLLHVSIAGGLLFAGGLKMLPVLRGEGAEG